MLTGDLVRPHLRVRDGQLTVAHLNISSRKWIGTAQTLIGILRDNNGHPRASFDDAVTQFIDDQTEYNIIRGLAKVLTDSATFIPLDPPLPAAELRAEIFSNGPAFTQADAFHLQTREGRIAAVAAQHELQPADIERFLYADRVSAFIQTDAGPAWEAVDLLQRYNLELTRAALYWSNGMTVYLYDSFKEFWRYVKLFKLMFWATPLDDGGYQVQLDGPISPFVKSTTRYGRQLAAFLPALFLCDQWQMNATVRLNRFKEPLHFQLDYRSRLVSHFKQSGEFDSRMEADFAAEFEAKFGHTRGKWQLEREDEVILLGDTVMIPDFSVIERKTGRRVLIEILGFWHPDYVKRKLAKIRTANRRDLLLLVYDGARVSPEKLTNMPGEVISFKKKPVLKEVIGAVERTLAALEP